MLADASDRELGALRAALAELTPGAFAALFAPGPERATSALPEATADRLRALGLAYGPDEALRGRFRIRRRGDRFYFLELPFTAQYHQDVWPETDALLAIVEAAPPARLLDVGTGSGIVAIEAAARGHRVVATDLYATAVALARLNARLNGVELELRVGHLFEPVAGERFDLVATAPHYGRTFDQLRLEVLSGALGCLTPTGRLALATALEWEDGRLGVESLLRPLAARAAVRVEPIVADEKRDWFHLARAEAPIARLVSRHRFVVTVDAAGPPGLAVGWPRDPPRVDYVPLSRLRRGSTATAVLASRDDAAVLRALLAALAEPTVVIDAAPVAFLDACRLGTRPCVAQDGAAGAILDADGGVRPCTHGAPIARASDTRDALAARLRALADETAARRGCASCPAQPSCSQCLFPTPFEEAEYCALLRAELPRLPILHRLLETLRRFGVAGPVRVARWPRRAWCEPDGARSRLQRLSDRWNALEAWTVAAGGRSSLWLMRDGELAAHEIDDAAAALGERLADEPDRALDELAPALSPSAIAAALERLESLLV